MSKMFMLIILAAANMSVDQDRIPATEPIMPSEYNWTAAALIINFYCGDGPIPFPEPTTATAAE